MRDILFSKNCAGQSLSWKGLETHEVPQASPRVACPSPLSWSRIALKLTIVHGMVSAHYVWTILLSC